MYFQMVTSGTKGDNQTGAQDDSHTNTPQNSSSPLNPCQTGNKDIHLRTLVPYIQGLLLNYLYWVLGSLFNSIY